MHIRTKELLNYLDAQRVVLRQAFDDIPAELREQQPAADRWSVANVIEHLAIVEGRIADRLSNAIAEARRAGIGPETATDEVLPTLDIRRVTDRSTRVTAPEAIRPTGLDATAAWDALERSTTKVRDALLAGDGLALGTLSLPHPIFGQISLYHWFGFIGAHEARHTAQIREVGAVATAKSVVAQ